jgi:hypothetical protein
MSGDPVPCANCGAMMVPQPDGRTYACTYCNTRVQVAIEGRQIAAGMRLDLANADAFLAQLAQTLSTGFAEGTRIDAHGGQVRSIEVTIEQDVFLARREGQRIVAQHRRVVRGVALRTVKHPLDKWVKLLTDALAAEANTNARAAWVLSQIGSGDVRT